MKHLLSVIMILFTTLSWGQKNKEVFEDGYIVTLTNDTIVGQIKILKEIDAYNKVVFKDTKNRLKTYNASQLLEYFYFDNKYVSAYYENKPCFFRLLIGGNVKLFKLLAYTGEQEPELVFFALPKGEDEVIKLDENKLNKQLQQLFKVNETLKYKLSKQKNTPLHSDTLQYYFMAFNYQN